MTTLRKVLALCLACDAIASAVQKVANPSHISNFQLRGLAPRNAAIKLHIAPKQHDEGLAIEQQLLQVSDPNSALFRQHLNASEILDLSGPADDSVKAIQDWLARHDLLRVASLAGGIFDVVTTIDKAEELLDATYFVYSDGSQDVVRTEVYHLPEAVAGHVDFVTPTTAFPETREHVEFDFTRGNQETVLSKRTTCGTNDTTTPTCIRQIYDISFDGLNFTVQPDRTTFGVYATEAAVYNSSDTQKYLQDYNPPAAAASASYEISDTAAPDPAEIGGAKFETGLCTQTLLGLAWPAKGVVYNRGGVFGTSSPGQTYDPFVTFLQELIRNDTVPSVISVSESFNENQMDPVYARRLCSMMAQISARGVTLLFSSGNNGANGNTPSPQGDHKDVFEPRFPASCPWVTAVGGTTDLADEKATTQETIPAMAKLGFVSSGGGFSTIFARPQYQASVVENYIKMHVPGNYSNLSGFNSSGRGYPDVSAFSTLFPTYVGGAMIPIGGTSAATPTWAAIITLLNDYEASRGRPSLGFINPWLYNLTSGLKDIVEGGNNVGECDRAQGCSLGQVYGYNVTEGWDPVTGLGSPRFRDLVKMLEDYSP
jgi:tripeptidyl-peptidase-1